VKKKGAFLVISSLIIARQETTFLTGKRPGITPPPGSMMSQVKVIKVVDSLKLRRPTTRTSMSQAKVMKVLISPNLGRPTIRTSTSQAKVMGVVDCSKLSSEKRCPLISLKLRRLIFSKKRGFFW